MKFSKTISLFSILAILLTSLPVSLVSAGEEVVSERGTTGRNEIHELTGGASVPVTMLEVEGESQSIDPSQIPDGLTSAQWASIQQSIVADQYNFSAENDASTTLGATAYNPSQNWDLAFGAQGLSVTPRGEGEDWVWGLSLSAYGYEGNLTGLKDLSGLDFGQNTLTYQWDSNISEWWINNSAGLEQGFTLQERPASSGGSNLLIVEMEVMGNLTPAQIGGVIHFQDESSETVLIYDKLHVTDAEGKVIPAQFTVDNSQLTIRIIVKDSHAVYPLTIDPWTQTAKLLASDGSEADHFGRSVSISGDTVVVGAHLDDDDGGDSGSAYIFERNHGGEGNWGQSAKLTASDGAESDKFGWSVSVSGDTIVVGAFLDDDNGSDSGSAYIFERDLGGA